MALVWPVCSGPSISSYCQHLTLAITKPEITQQLPLITEIHLPSLALTVQLCMCPPAVAGLNQFHIEICQTVGAFICVIKVSVWSRFQMFQSGVNISTFIAVITQATIIIH